MVPEIIIELVHQYRDVITAKEILAVFDIPKSTYYRWKNKPKLSTTLTQNEELVLQLCRENKYRYGYRKITALIKQKRTINKNTVQRIMQHHHCQCRVKIKHYRHTRTQAITANES